MNLKCKITRFKKLGLQNFRTNLQSNKNNEEILKKNKQNRDNKYEYITFSTLHYKLLILKRILKVNSSIAQNIKFLRVWMQIKNEK